MLLLIFALNNYLPAQELDKNFFMVNGDVYSIKRDNCFLYVGGAFNYIGKSATGVAVFSQFSDQMNNRTPELGDNDYIEVAVPDGKGGWFVAGNFSKINKVPRKNIAHIQSDMSVDLRFVPFSFPVNFFYTISCDGDYVYIGGDFSFIYGIRQYKNLIRLNRFTGELDDKWYPNPSGPIRVIKDYGNYLYVGGNFVQISDYTQKSFAVISKSTGQYIKSYGSSEIPKFIYEQGDSVIIGGSSAMRVGLQAFTNTVIPSSTNEPLAHFPTSEKIVKAIPDGSGGWYLFGKFTNLSAHFTSHFGHLLADLSPDKAFKQIHLMSINNIKSDMLIHNGFLYCGGNFSVVIKGFTYNNLIRLSLADGEIDTSFHPNPNNSVYTLMTNGNNLYFGGTFTEVDGIKRSRIAALNTMSKQLLSWNPGADNTVWSIVAHANGFFAAGDFSVIDAVNQNAFAEFSFTGVKTGLNLNLPSASSINEMWLDDSLVYLGGKYCVTFKGLLRCNLSAFNYKFVGFNDFNPLPVLNPSGGNAWYFDVASDTIFIAGNFKTINSTKRNYIAALNRHNGKLFNWDIVSDGQVDVICNAFGKLLLSGNFEYFKHVEAPLVYIRPQKNIIGTVNIKLSGGKINDITINGSRLYLAGKFDSINGVFNKNIGLYDLSSNSVLKWVTSDTLKSEVLKMSLINNRIFLYTNSMFKVNGTDRYYLASYNVNDGMLNNWNPSCNSLPVSMVSSDTSIFIFGGFTAVNSRQAWNLAKINTCTNLIENWFPIVTSGYVYDIEIMNDTLVIGGSFSKINNKERLSFAAINKNTAGVLNTPYQGVTGSVYAITYDKNNIYACGNFSYSSSTKYDLFKLKRQSGTIENWVADTINIIKNAVLRQIAEYKDYLVIGGNAKWTDNTDYSLVFIEKSTGKTIKKIKGLDIPATNAVLSFTQKDSILFVGGKFNGLIPSLHQINLNNLNIVTQNTKTLYNITTSGLLRNILCVSGDKLPGYAYSKVTFIDVSNDSLLAEAIVPYTTGNINCLDITDNELIIGGSLTEVEGTRITKLARYFNPTAYFKNGVFRLSPNKTSNDGVLKFEIAGNGFHSKTFVKFTRKGSSSMVPDSMFIQRQLISGILVVDMADTGWWNLEVTIPNDSTYILKNALYIEPEEVPELWIDLIGPEIVVAGMEYSYNLSYGNRSNVGLFGVPVAIAVPASVKFAFGNLYLQFTDSTGQLDSVEAYVKSDTLVNKYLKGYSVYSFLVPYLAPHAAEQLKLKFTFPIDTSHVAYCIGYPLYLYNFQRGNHLVINKDAEHLFKGLINDISGNINAAQLKKSVNSIGNELYESMLAQNDNKPAFDFAKYLGKLLISNVSKVDIKKDPADFASAFFNGGGSNPDTNNNLYYKHFILKIKPVVGVYSMDPNMKYGPAEKYVGSGDNLSYMITFENIKSATAPAQMVRILDTLDKKVYNLSSFTPQTFGFGKYSFSMPQGVYHYSGDYNLLPDKDLIVRVKLDFDTSTGIIVWYFSSIDPNTMLPVKNPLSGFLPPNNTTHDGEGYISYNVKLKEGLNEGTIVSNRAMIYFDNNLPIATPAWQNIVDDISPVSKIDSLPMQTKNTSFVIDWQGSDAASGLKHYDIYFSVDGGNYYPLYLFKEENSVVFKGDVNHTYRFYSVSTDYALNREAIPQTHDAIITIIPDAIEEQSDENQIILYQNLPNPVKKQSTIRFYLPEGMNISLELISANAHHSQVLESGFKTKGIHEVKINTQMLSEGIYFYVLKTPETVFLKKMIVVQ